MDQLGNIVRELLRQARSQRVLNAVALAKEYRKDGMTDGQIEEMLYSDGFDQDVIASAIELSTKRAK